MFKVGLIGFGRIGNTHGRAYKAMPDVKVVAVADTEEDRRQKAVELFGAAPYESAQDLIDNVEVDMVDICLPTYLHAEYSIKAMEKGFHVLCEKPMALNITQCEDMVAAAKRTNRMLMIGHCIRFWPEYHYLKSVFDSGVFGKLQVLSMTRMGSKTVGSWQDWMLDDELSGSQTVDRHIHDTDFILYLLGKPRSIRTVGHADESGLSHTCTQYIYDGPAVFAEGGGNIPKGYAFSMSYRAVFDKAAIEFSGRATPKLRVYPWDGQPYEPEYEVVFDGEASAKEIASKISQLGAYWAEIRYLVDCIKAGRQPSVTTPEQALESIKVVLAERESGLTGREIPL